jgi:predicted nucleic acid-binding protein
MMTNYHVARQQRPVALAIHDHIHHDSAITWLASTDDLVATCPITQDALIGILRWRVYPDHAVHQLRPIAARQRHEFWTDDVSFTDVSLRGVIGHRQVTDAYLAQLARARGGQLATFDRGLAGLHTDVAHLVPTG